MPLGEHASGRCRASRGLSISEAADLAVAQTVVDERENSAGDGHVGFGLAAPLGDRLESATARRLPRFPCGTDADCSTLCVQPESESQSTRPGLIEDKTAFISSDPERRERVESAARAETSHGKLGRCRTPTAFDSKSKDPPYRGYPCCSI